MDRMSFLKKAVLAVTGGHFMIGSLEAPRANASNSEEDMFKEAWITSLMENLEEQLDKKSRCRLMHSCGRDCARRGAIKLAESAGGDVKKMMEKFSGFPGCRMEFAEDRSISVTYEKCFCELVSKGPERLPETYCECSKGWLLEIFGTAAGKAVQVDILETIKRGGNFCRFVVKV